MSQNCTIRIRSILKNELFGNRYSLNFQKGIYLVFGIRSIFTILCNSGLLIENFAQQQTIYITLLQMATTITINTFLIIIALAHLMKLIFAMDHHLIVRELEENIAINIPNVFLLGSQMILNG